MPPPESEPAHWFSAPDGRDNPATDLDQRHPAGISWSTGNSAHPLIDGTELFDSLVAELDAVRSGDRIFFSAWVGVQDKDLDEAGHTLGGLLFRALGIGASVHALFWWPFLTLHRGHVPPNRRFVTALRRRGGAALLDQRVRPIGCHHQKFLVIRRPERPSNDIAFVGGIDPCPSRRDDDRHRGDPDAQDSMDDRYGVRPAWHDAHLQVRGPAVDDVEHCFRERWADATAPGRGPILRARRSLTSRRADQLPARLPPPPRCGPHAVQLLRTYPAKRPPFPFAPHGERSVARGYLKALRNARRLVYVEDQFLWSPVVAEAFAAALRREPELRLVAVVPRLPEQGSFLETTTYNAAHREAMDLLRAAGEDRVDIYDLENTAGLPIYLHSKLCVVDDHWALVGSANLNRRSWSYDSELAAAVVDDGSDAGSPAFARALRLRLWREHLGREPGNTADLADVTEGAHVLRRAAADLDRWHEHGRVSPRPSGHLRAHTRPAVSPLTQAWAGPVRRTVIDPDGRPAPLRRAGRW
ncbi:phospholipase [Saccharopolyspora sp. HNM0983]|uniref:Phospholipase n=1 Tax=Saccharopolyspora montiporae TaxID=2781240 RepID=A0A929BA02_9PSEU|nr:phospholipase D family protein [Saccharopolyspora sp. HNM0983]MBE9373752.1 phospholipase [Saccharopolyspora sp. HNM0983]